MRNSPTESLIIFIIVCTFLIVLLISFITYILYCYQQKQNAYYKDLEELKITHANEMLHSQIEIQEQTFENISREMHDNIGQKLTLAKLHLNTMNIKDADKAAIQLNDSVKMISEAINSLRDISRSMSSEIILNNGFIRGLELEVEQLNKFNCYEISFTVSGDPVYLDSQKELVLFRIVQEALNNIVKHAFAKNITISLNYDKQLLSLSINDDGKGVSKEDDFEAGTGISNMNRRANFLHGKFEMLSDPGNGTIINIKIPLYENE